MTIHRRARLGRVLLAAVLALLPAACGDSSGPGSGQVSVTLGPSTLLLAVGETSQLAVNVSAPSGASTAVQWQIDDPSVVSVQPDGTVQGLATGTATITAVAVADPSKTASVPVAVTTTKLTVTITGFENAISHDPVVQNSLRDSIEVVTSVPGAAPVDLIELQITGARDSTFIVTPSGDGQPMKVGWNTNARTPGGAVIFPNGSYLLRLRARLGDVSSTSTTVFVTLIN